MREKDIMYTVADVKANAINKEPIPDPKASGYVFYFLPANYPPDKHCYEAAVDAYSSDFWLSDTEKVSATAVVHYLSQFDQSYSKTH